MVRSSFRKENKLPQEEISFTLAQCHRPVAGLRPSEAQNEDTSNLTGSYWWEGGCMLEDTAPDAPCSIPDRWVTSAARRNRWQLPEVELHIRTSGHEVLKPLRSATQSILGCEMSSWSKLRRTLSSQKLRVKT